MYEIFNQSRFVKLRKALRKNITPQEYKLWLYLKGKNLGVKWRRQHGIGPYIVDFYCKEKHLVIELDGSQHLDAKEYDRKRDLFLEDLGIRVLRFWNNEINTNMEGVIVKIQSVIDNAPL